MREVIPDRICKHCGTITWQHTIVKRHGKIYDVYQCETKYQEAYEKSRKRRREYYVKYWQDNKEELQKQKREYSQRTGNAAVYKYMKNNRAKINAIQKKSNEKAKSSGQLPDWYVRASLYPGKIGVSAKDIPTELTNLKRKELCLKQKRKEILKQAQ